MSKKWKFSSPDPSLEIDLEHFSTIPEPLIRLLTLRGFCTEESIHSFLHPRLENLSDPFLLPDMKPAVDRIWKAITQKETILVFGDYDVDGITSTALLTCVLTQLGAQVVPFIPDRLAEGYGLSSDAATRCLAEFNPDLIITVDCGTNATESVAEIQSHGVDIIITDHHEPNETTAQPLALINPKTGTIDDLKILAGVGVAFKVAHALLKQGRALNIPEALQINLRQYLDLVALGTVADIVPLTHENRILVRHGLAILNTTQREGLRALKDIAKIDGETDTYHLGFQLGPRINAAGRIGQPMQALQLLITDNPGEAREIAAQLDRTNQERRTLEQKISEEAFAQLEDSFDPVHDFGLMVASTQWHPGVIGIVASRLSRHFNRPTIVLSIDPDGNARGSGRSIPEFDILNGLHTCNQHLLKYGGHMMAAGVSLNEESIAAFKIAFNEHAREALKKHSLLPTQFIDVEITTEDLNWTFMEQLKKLRPFGQDQAEPIWAIRNIKIVGAPMVVGKKHLKFAIGKKGQSINAIAFNYALCDLPKGPLDIAFLLKENSWRGNTSLQLQVQDIRPSQLSK